MTRFTQTDDPATLPTDRAPVLVIGGGEIGLGLARALVEDGRPATFVGDCTAGGVDSGVDLVTTQLHDASDLQAVLDAVDEVGAVVAAGTDSEALLFAHLARRQLDKTPVFALVDRPSRMAAFDGVDVKPLQTATVMARVVGGHLSEETDAARSPEMDRQ